MHQKQTSHSHVKRSGCNSCWEDQSQDIGLCCVVCLVPETLRLSTFNHSFWPFMHHIMLIPEGNVSESILFAIQRVFHTGFSFKPSPNDGIGRRETEAPDRPLLPPPKAGHWSHAPTTYRSGRKDSIHFDQEGLGGLHEHQVVNHGKPNTGPMIWIMFFYQR